MEVFVSFAYCLMRRCACSSNQTGLLPDAIQLPPVTTTPPSPLNLQRITVSRGCHELRSSKRDGQDHIAGICRISRILGLRAIAARGCTLALHTRRSLQRQSHSSTSGGERFLVGTHSKCGLL